MRVVIDTNVLVSSVLVSGGPPARVALLWRADAFQLVSSPQLVAELTRVLSRTKVRRRFSSPELGEALLDQIADYADTFEPTFTLDVARDPDDNRVLEAAVTGAADVIVSGDDDLLSLGSYEDIPIMTAVQFLAMLEEIERLDRPET